MNRSDFEAKRRRSDQMARSIVRSHDLTPAAPVSLAQAVRARRGVQSIRALADELGELQQTLFMVERGRQPRPSTFVKLMKWLNVIDHETAQRLMQYTQRKEQP